MEKDSAKTYDAKNNYKKKEKEKMSKLQTKSSLQVTTITPLSKQVILIECGSLLIRVCFLVARLALSRPT